MTTEIVTIRNSQGKRLYQCAVEEDGAPMGIHRSGLPVAQESGRALANAVQSAVREGVSLRGAQLSGALDRLDLSSGDFRDAVFSGADCSGTSFTGADLSGARAEYASFARASFLGTKLDSFSGTECDFIQAILERSSLRYVRLASCNLTAVRAPFADAERAQIESCMMYGSDWSNALWRALRAERVNLERATLRAVIAEGASIAGSMVDAECRGAMLARAKLSVDARRAAFVECDLREAMLSGDFTDAAFSGARMTDARWQRAHGANLWDVAAA